MAYRPRHLPSLSSSVGRDVDHLEVSPALPQSSYAIAPSPIAASVTQVADQEVDPLAYSFFPSVQVQPQVVTDRRIFTPTPENIPSSKRWAAKFEASQPQQLNYMTSGVKLQASPYVLICIRRKARRAVLLATGKGGTNRKARRTPKSDIWC